MVYSYTKLTLSILDNSINSQLFSLRAHLVQYEPRNGTSSYIRSGGIKTLAGEFCPVYYDRKKLIELILDM